MKNLELTVVPLLVILSLSPAAGQSFSLPAASQAHPDVLGIKVGVSTFNDVRSIFSGTALALRVEERRAWLWGPLSTGIGHIRIPNSEYVELLTGVSRTYQGPANSLCSEIVTNCQDLEARFSAPPNAGTVLALTREIHFANGPLTETVIQGLVDKYGQPGFRSSYGDKGVELRLVWAWAPDGRQLTLNDRHICASQAVATMGLIDGSKDALQAGCAAMLFVILNQENSIMQFETIHVIDHYGILAADTKTRALLVEGVATYEKCERDQAAKRSVPSEFSDAPTGTKASPQAADSASSCTPTSAPFAKAGPCDQVCGFITVNVTGRPVNVSIDYARAGQTPLINYKVRPGLHRITLFVGREMVNESVQIDSGATVVKSYDATPR